MKITKNMQVALSELYNNKTAPKKRTTINALYSRNLVDSSNSITKKGKVYIISKLPLKKQCEALGIKFDSISLPCVKKPESTLMDTFKKQGSIGISCEGIGILTVLKALILDKLDECKLPYLSRNDVCEVYLEGHLSNLTCTKESLAYTIQDISKPKFLSNFQEIIRQPYIQATYPQLNKNFASELFDKIEKRNFIALLYKLIEDPYQYRKGWPDITLITSGSVKFIEVKVNDKLHESQIITILEMKSIFPGLFSVCKLLLLKE